MSFSFSRKTTQTDDTKRKTSLLKDNSWIKKDVDEDEPVDRDPNFGKTILSKYRSTENLDSPTDPLKKNTTTVIPTRTNSSVQSLSKRFSASQGDLNKSSTLPSNYGKTTTYNKRISASQEELDKSSTLPKNYSKSTTYNSSTTSSVKADPPKISSTTTTTTTKDGTKTTTITTRTSKENIPSSETFTQRVLSDTKAANKGQASTTYSSKTSSNQLSPKSTTEVTITERTFSSKTSATSPVKTTKSTEDQLFDTLIPDSIKSAKSTSDRYENTSNTSSTTYTKTSIIDNSAEDFLSDSLVSKPSTPSSPGNYLSQTFTTKSTYSTPQRKMSEKDPCSYCHKPMQTDTKIILDELNIYCHATCFKCEECNRPLGHLKAGDSMWIYREKVHCENCFETTREKWRR